MDAKKAYGDFQTPLGLAKRVVGVVEELFGSPELVVEPTMGVGAFLEAALERWGASPQYEGYELNPRYVALARQNLTGHSAKLYQRDFFNENWQANLARSAKKRVLVIGNPPWVTNSELGQMRSNNLPSKSNFVGLRGLDARTGKANFDIAECMLIRLIESLPSEGVVAMLCKTMTARKVLRHFWKSGQGPSNARLFSIDAKKEFNVSVDACLFVATGRTSSERVADVADQLDTEAQTRRFGYSGGDLVSDMDAFHSLRDLDGSSPQYIWRSGVKHDAAKVMELTRTASGLVNGFGEIVDLERDHLFPLLKSSDLANGRTDSRKVVLITQRHTGNSTTDIEVEAPKTWDYLLRHADVLDNRKSSIYRNRSRFSVFGIGPYSFSPWKIAISGLYKQLTFVMVPPSDGVPTMVDDTAYFVPCYSECEAEILVRLLNSHPAQKFLRSLVFMDSKRPITAEILRRISLANLARKLGISDEFEGITKARSKAVFHEQMLLPI